MKPPAVEDCPSPMNHESYQDVVVSGVVGTVVLVVVGVVGGNVVSLDIINRCCLRRRIRASLSLLCCTAVSRWFGEYPLLTSTTRLLPLTTAGFCTLVVP